MRRIEGESRREQALDPAGVALAYSEPVVAALAESDFDTARLPLDHPQWVKDAVTISTKARELLARLRPALVTILSFWDHRVRALAIGNTRVSIDPSGSYRID